MTEPGSIGGGRRIGGRSGGMLRLLGGGALALALMAAAPSAWTQSAPVRPLPPAAGTAGPPTAPSAAEPAPPAATPAPPAVSQTAGTDTPGARQQTLTLKDLGANSPIRLLGIEGEGSLPFSVRRDEAVTGGEINLSFAYSPALIPDLSHLTVLLNNEVLGSIPLPKEKASGETVSLPLNPALLQPDNRVLFRFIGHYTLGCENPLDPQLWLVLSNSSAITMQLRKLELANDLALLPAPFYDSKDMQSLTLPFVLPAQPTAATLQAAGIVASWFGSLASYKGASFPASLDAVPNGNAVVVATEANKPSGVSLPAIAGPTVSVVPNPGNPEAKLLLVLGRSPEELTAAAETLALAAGSLSGQTQVVGAPTVPERQAYDAPRWIPLDRPVSFGELVQPSALQGSGMTPGLLTVNFRTAPDIFVWGNNTIPLDVRYRFAAGNWFDLGGSRLDASINNSYLTSLPLSLDGAVKQLNSIVSPGYVLNQQWIQVPPYYIFGQNQLQFYYLFRPRNITCEGALPTNIQEAIDPASTIDLGGVQHFTTLPNLAFFVNSGFPFTKWADLSQTAVVMPDQPTAADVQTYLTLMGMMGDSTGFPVVRVSVINAAAVNQAADKDLIVLGSVSRQPLVARWAGDARLQVAGGRLRVASASSIDNVYSVLDPNAKQERERVDQAFAQQGDNLATMFAMESPLKSGRTVVFITGAAPEKQLTVLGAFRNRDLNPLIQGDLMMAAGDKVSSFRIGSEYSVGRLNPITRVRWWFGNSPLLLIVFTVFGVLIIALVAYWMLSRIAARRLAGWPGPVP